MFKRLLFMSAGLIGLALYKNAKSGYASKNLDRIRSKKGDSPHSPGKYKNFKITSHAFAPGRPIPELYTCEGNDISPPLEIAGTPKAAQSLALVLEDPDSPMPPVFDHWLMWNICPKTTYIAPGQVPDGAVEGRNSLKNSFYNGPCTPNGTHRYCFTLYALDDTLNLPAGANKKQLLNAMKGHILAECEMVGLYTANKTTQTNLVGAVLKAAVKV